MSTQVPSPANTPASRARRRLRRDRHEREDSGNGDEHEAAHEGGVYAAGVRER